jgi:hypothetical protein
MSDKKKLFTTEHLNDFLQQNYRTPHQILEEGGALNEATAGLLQTDVPEPTPSFIAAKSTKILSHKNSHIVFGRDRPSTLGSGFGGVGAQGTNTIDIVVGRMSSVEIDDGTHVDNSFTADAARIYISQLTKVDENFGLADSPSVPKKPASAIAMKADGIRIIGREGVKIVTGGHPGAGEKTSLGGRIGAAPGIDLIAGNFTDPRRTLPDPWPDLTEYGFPPVDTLQPLLLGKNTKQALQELSQIIDEIWSAVYWMAIIQNNVLSTMSACPVGPAPARGGGGVGPVVSGVSLAMTQLMPTWVFSPLGQTRNTKMVWERNYLEPYGHKYICSKSVRST